MERGRGKACEEDTGCSPRPGAHAVGHQQSPDGEAPSLASTRDGGGTHVALSLSPTHDGGGTHVAPSLSSMHDGGGTHVAPSLSPTHDGGTHMFTGAVQPGGRPCRHP